MQIRPLDETLSVAPQITVDEVAEAARLGFRTLVANRPDAEEPGQPAMASIEAAAREHGLEWIYLPVQSGNVLDSDADEFAPLIEAAEKPVLAFCRSGMRCTVLWALSNAHQTPADALILRAEQAGYNIAGLKPRLVNRSGQSH